MCARGRASPKLICSSYGTRITSKRSTNKIPNVQSGTFSANCCAENKSWTFLAMCGWYCPVEIQLQEWLEGREQLEAPEVLMYWLLYRISTICSSWNCPGLDSSKKTLNLWYHLINVYMNYGFWQKQCFWDIVKYIY